MYTPIKSNPTSTPSNATTLLSRGGVDKRDLPQLLDPKFAQSIVNYWIYSDGQLIKRKGVEELFTVAGVTGFTMLEKATDDLLMIGYGTTVAAYTISTDTVTNIKTDFSANSGFEGQKYGNYFFIANGVDLVWRIDLTTLAITEVTGSPTAKGVKAINSRLFAWTGSTVYYSAIDDGTNPPFTNWTLSTNADGPGEVYYRNAGDVNSVIEVDNNILVFAEDGKYAFYINTIDSAGTLKKIDVFQMSRLDAGGARGAINTDDGIFYANEAGLWQLVALGQSDIPLSDQEFNTSLLLGQKYFDDLNLDSSAIIYDRRRRYIYLTCRKNSSTNNFILAYNLDFKAYTEFRGLNISRFTKIGESLYGASSTGTKIFTCFEGYSDDGFNISTEYEQELQLGQLYTRQDLLGLYSQGSLSSGTTLTIDFDIYDIDGQLVKNKSGWTWTSDYSLGIKYVGWGESAWGGAWGNDIDLSSLTPSFSGCRPFIRNFQRVILKISGADQSPHVLHWISLEAAIKRKIRRRNLTKIT